MFKKMNISKIFLISVIAILFITIVWFIGSYNGLIKTSTEIDEAWANVETQYQRRADLIPNLIEVVKKSASFQQETFTEVTALRSQWQSAKAAGDRLKEFQIGEQMGSALSRLLVTVERYPDLDLDTFKNLQAQLEGTENRVAVARTRYNDKVKIYNVKIRKIPTVIIANMFGFEKEPFFEAKPGTEDTPKVSFE
jgi:LemA protein